MRKRCYIPFGYKVLNGEIITDERETDVVKMIYNEYINGSLSYKAIAELLTAKRIPYRGSISSWNKLVIKRILENPKYLGIEGYPRLVSESEYNAVQVMKTEKYTRKDINESNEIKVIKDKAVCFECGEKFVRHIVGKNSNKKEIWHCNNNNCKIESNITDDILINAVIAVLNRVISAPNIIAVESTNSYNHNLKITMLTNEINRELEKKEINEDYVRELIMGCASEKYASCNDGNKPYLTEKLKSEFENRVLLDKLDIELFERMVQNILIETDGTIHVRFINQKMITYMKE